MANLVPDVPLEPLGALASPPVEGAPSDLILNSIRGQGYEVRDWLTSFPLLMVAIDPYTHESAWILETAGRIIEHYAPADVRVGFLCTASNDECEEFLGPWADNYLTFSDPDRAAVKSLGIERLPSLVHIAPNTRLNVANGWDPQAWRAICKDLATYLSWSTPLIPQAGDPAAFNGTPAT